MLARSILPFALLLIPIAPAILTTSAAQSARLPRFLYTAARTYEPIAWLKGNDRFSSGASIFLSDGDAQRPLIPEFAVTADPAVSFDGQRMLFAAKPHANDVWQIWELSLEEAKTHRITQGKGDCIRPLYLPADRIVYARKVEGHFVIETSDLSGENTLSLT